MDSISSVSASIQAVNQVMQTANTEAIDAAKKMMQFSVEMAVGKETGKGEMVDIVA